ncbi:MAG: trypsin-like serine protease [Myxococcales bacterium]|nr:trypsin-like serine protease [Myxococcales bacterium]
MLRRGLPICLLLPLASALLACPGAGKDQCGDTRELDAVYYGTDHPTHVELSLGQERAIGVWANGAICTGTVIADGWVLTAVHCDITESQQFCIGTSLYEPDACFDIIRIINSPTYSYLGDAIELDLALVELADFDLAAHNVEPIPIVTQPLEFLLAIRPRPEVLANKKTAASARKSLSPRASRRWRHLVMAPSLFASRATASRASVAATQAGRSWSSTPPASCGWPARSKAAIAHALATIASPALIS